MVEYKRFHISKTKEGGVKAEEKRDRLKRYKDDKSCLMIYEADNLRRLLNILGEELGDFTFHKRRGEYIIKYGEGISKRKKKEEDEESEESENAIKLVVQEKN